jgi:hypothetical protein
MKFGFLALAAVVALVVAAVWLVSAPRESTPHTQQPPQNNSPPTTQQTNTPVEVTWRGYITAVVADFIDPTTGRMIGGYTEWFLDLVNGTTVRLDFTNATFRLRDHFAIYVGNPDRPVYVRGIWNGTVLKALEIYD